MTERGAAAVLFSIIPAEWVLTDWSRQSAVPQQVLSTNPKDFLAATKPTLR